MNRVMVDYCVKIKPSQKLRDNVKQLNKISECAVKTKSVASNQETKDTAQNPFENLFSTSEDYAFISSVQDQLKENFDINDLYNSDEIKFAPDKSKTSYLGLDDLISLAKELKKQPRNDNNVYLHELLENSLVCVPDNEKVERNADLDKRCAFLKAQQDNLYYKSITKNVDNTRIREPEETIAYQMKQLNKQLIAVAQFIISVLTGFAFGFIGIELIVGNLDFGFRLLLGIMSALTVALAELYFLAKHLTEE